MKIAFASEENKGLESMLAQHFGKCSHYVFVELEDKKIISVVVKKNPFFNQHEQGEVPKFIAKEKANIIIAGGMGSKAIEWFEKLGVESITTKPKKIKNVLSDYFAGKLK